MPEDARVGHVDIDLAEAPPGLGDQGLDVGLAADVAAHGHRADGPRHTLGALQVDVGDHDAAGAFGDEPLGQSGTDAAGAAGDDRDLASNLHGFSPVGWQYPAGATSAQPRRRQMRLWG